MSYLAGLLQEEGARTLAVPAAPSFAVPYGEQEADYITTTVIGLHTYAGRLGDAEPLLEAVLAASRASLRESDPATLLATSKLGSLREAQGASISRCCCYFWPLVFLGFGLRRGRRELRSGPAPCTALVDRAAFRPRPLQAAWRRRRRSCARRTRASSLQRGPRRTER